LKQKTLYDWCVENNKEHMIKEFLDGNNSFTPHDVTYGSYKNASWKCSDCSESYESTVFRKVSIIKNGCPYCEGKKVSRNNCLAKSRPDVFAMLRNKEGGYLYTEGSTKRVDFICPDCKGRVNQQISSVVSDGLKCRNCSDGISYPEKFVIGLLNQIGVKFECQKTFDWSKNLKTDKQKKWSYRTYDFYIPSINCIIEAHGSQHYTESSFGKKLSEEKENDEYKKDLALDNDIDIYIILDCRESDQSFLKNTILESALNIIFDLSDIDWSECNKNALKSNVKIACEYWNNGLRSPTKIGKKLKVAKPTARKYLKLGAESGLCDYEPQKTGSYTRVDQLTKDGKLVKRWSSISDASRELNISPSSIVNVCKGRKKSLLGFKWKYID